MKYVPETQVPSFRKDVQITHTIHNGIAQVYAYDTFGYADDGIYLTYEAVQAVQLFNNTTTVQEIAKKLFGEVVTDDEVTFVCGFIEQIDAFGYLESADFENKKSEIIKAYSSSEIRMPICAGGSYPADAEQLSVYIRGLLASCSAIEGSDEISGIIVPHIDYRVGAESYAPAFKAIENSDAEVVVIFATSHYWWEDLFVLTEKDFITPLGRVKTDREIIKSIREHYPFPLTQNDMAHKPEHSIELELPFLQTIWSNKQFTIVPILVTSFHKYMEKDKEPSEYAEISEFIKAVQSAIHKSGKKALYISSGDLAHIGRKFGDDYDAMSKFDEVREADMQLLQSLQNCNSGEFFRRIATVKDKWKICGCSPNYMLLETLQPNKGILLDYKQWDERERASGVTFGTVAYYES